MTIRQDKTERKAHLMRCEEVLQQLLIVINSGKPVTFHRDWGGNSLTVVSDGGHWHLGDPDATFEKLVAQLHKHMQPK